MQTVSKSGARSAGFTTTQIPRRAVLIGSVLCLGSVSCCLWSRNPDDRLPGIQVVRAPGQNVLSANTMDQRGLNTAGILFFTKIKSLWEFPEYTDDQRFNDGHDVYGPIAHIVPVDSVKYWAASDYAAAGAMGKLVGGIVVNDTNNIAGATLPDPYRKLNLVVGNNCVYLAKPADWTAYVVVENTVDPQGPCPPNHSTSDPLTVLAVRDATYGNASDVPGVARFHEGAKGSAKGLTYFGLKCGDSWCVALPATMNKADTTPPFHAKPGKSRKWLVHGWHDVQHLGVGRLSTAVPEKPVTLDKTLEGSVVPDDSLGLRDVSEFKVWIHVATVQFTKKPDGTPYATRWNFVQEDNELYIKQDSKSATGWIGKVVNARTGRSKAAEYALVVKRDPHPGENLPGTARWAWWEKDEYIWVRCGDGCCWVSPPE
jgi:hypothetical protein